MSDKEARSSLLRRNTFILLSSDLTEEANNATVDKTQAAFGDSAGSSAPSRSYSFEPSCRRDSATE
jgi:hypothetical protein